MNILFVGDIYGKPGRRAASEQIPRLMVTRAVDFCIVNAENAAGGFGITEKIGQKVFAYGADVITMGNHVWDQRESVPYVKATERVLRPENFPAGVGGKGSGVFISRAGVPVGVVSLQGRTNMKPLDCPFQVGRETIAALREETPVIVVDFHAEATSEKIAFGWFADGQVSAVIGTHTHVQTADERVLPGGSAYITDVGMTGPHDSVIGTQKEIIVQQFLDRLPARYEPASGDVKLCGVLIDVDEETGKARQIERLRIDLEES